MPYKNIQFVKVKMELLEDHRFLYELNETQKGLYLLLLALAGKTNNKIKDDLVFIKGRLNIQSIVHEDLERISEVYTKFRLIDGYWSFDNFDREHNQILSRDIGISQGYPKDIQRIDKNRIEKNRIDTTLFDRFYSKYPRKQGKADGLKAFLKLNPNDELLCSIMNALDLNIKSEAWQKDGGKFIPLPATWIRGRRWEDEITPKEKKFKSLVL